MNDKAREIADGYLSPFDKARPHSNCGLTNAEYHASIVEAVTEAFDSQRKELEELRKELERERIRLAVCGVIALSNTTDTAKQSRLMREEYQSASAQDVANAVDKQMELRELCWELVQTLTAMSEGSYSYSAAEELQAERLLAKAKEVLK